MPSNADFTNTQNPLSDSITSTSSSTSASSKAVNDLRLATLLGKLYTGDDTSINDDYIVSIPSYGNSYVYQSAFIIKPLHTNVGASSININGIGKIHIKVNVNEDTKDGDISENQMTVLLYDGLNMQLLNPKSGATNSVTLINDTRDPSVSDYSYNLGKLWLNTATENVFVLVNNNVGAAVWKNITIENQLANYLPLSGTTELAGSIVPKDDLGASLGSGSKRFSDVYGYRMYPSYIYNLTHFSCNPTFYNDYYLGFGSSRDLKLYHNSSNDTSYISTQQNHDTVLSANPTGSLEIPMMTLKSDGSKVEANVPITDPTYGDYFNQSNFNHVITKSTSFTLSLLETNSTIKMTNGGSITIPTNANVPFLIGSKIDVISNTDGTITFNPLGGVTLLSKDNVKTVASKYSKVTLTKMNTDEWALTNLPVSGGGVETPKIYGVRYEDNGTDFTYTRLNDAQGVSVTRSAQQSIGSYTGRIISNGFANMEYWNEITRVIVDNNGVEYAREGEANYDDTLSNIPLSPKTHSVMVRIPKFYYHKKFIGSTITEEKFSKSRFTVDGANAWVNPGHFRDRNGDNVAEEVDYIYFPAFEGVLWDASANKAVSGNETNDNTSAIDFSNDLICSFNTIGYDGHADGLRPYAGLTITQFRTLCENRNNNSQYGWGQEWYLGLVTIQTLYKIMFADFDSQSVLSQGFTKSTNTKPIGVGHSSALDNQSGYVNVTKYYDGVAIPDSGTDNNGTECMSFLGIENFYGNNHKFIDGICSTSTYHIGLWQKEFNTMNTTTIPQQAWKDMFGFGWSSALLGYVKSEWRNSDTIEAAYLGNLIKDNSGSNSTYYADYSFISNSSVSYFGGAKATGNDAGMFYYFLNYGESSASNQHSCILCI